MSDVSELQAVYGGPATTTIHLHLPGFRTTKPRDGLYPKALCGVAAHLRSGIGYRHEAPTGRVFVPFEQAVRLEFDQQPPTDDPRPVAGPRRFCGKCLGLALIHSDLERAAVRMLLNFRIIRRNA